MKPSALLLRGAVAVALATALVLVAIVLIGRGPGPAKQAAPAAEPAPAPPAMDAVAALPAPAAAGATTAPAELEPAAAPSIRRSPSMPAAVDWASVPEAARVSDLGSALARPVYDALKAARDQMDSCFEEERRRLARQPAKSTADETADASTILILRLQSRPGGLDVVDSEIEALGDSSRELVSCCRIVLRGWPIPAPAAAGGKRYRLKYLLQ